MSDRSLYRATPQERRAALVERALKELVESLRLCQIQTDVTSARRRVDDAIYDAQQALR